MYLSGDPSAGVVQETNTVLSDSPGPALAATPVGGPPSTPQP